MNKLAGVVEVMPAVDIAAADRSTDALVCQPNKESPVGSILPPRYGFTNIWGGGTTSKSGYSV